MSPSNHAEKLQSLAAGVVATPGFLSGCHGVVNALEKGSFQRVHSLKILKM